ncbi:EscU/YscU/HrcU family type III secretion system export apparatus switch protein [Novosphingobium beihaiensis]|uniref:EscU/YscU/HrcU family type III secretion system export apparatus switch protein n=1 Tax=Novosphingobium beihaiensis TaxID=2930389 RepID=A0ABT0BVK1_9SPHN|nr:EscU/YscU/HrcU family type III secretion system export apparatus switch protein [Novosphingobium beihaiensis]MCJ2189084.1 EscU/YscU/HrcU family type III secretion system export apparatus switch protein [Novosphingobium beihaiensis]
MADKNDGGDKTEKPTQKRLRDARRKGDVAKSKDFGSAIGMAAWLVLAFSATSFVGARLTGLAREVISAAPDGEFVPLLQNLGAEAAGLTLLAAAFTLIPAAVIGIAGEFLQVGALVTTEKLKPAFDKLNPMEGLKRMVSLDNLFELIKTLIKAVLVLGVAGLVLAGGMGRYVEVLNAARWRPLGGMGPVVAGETLALTRSLTVQLIAGTFGIFLLVGFADRAWTQHRYIKKMMMSRRDLKQEHKDNEGDPHLKGQRRQMHEEWANQNAVGAAGQASVLLTNPTHIAIALDYDPDECPVPVVAAKGEGPLAAAMRRRAAEEGVPIVRNVQLARTLFATAPVNTLIPSDHFDAIAEIILWARRARAGELPLEREEMS